MPSPPFPPSSTASIGSPRRAEALLSVAILAALTAWPAIAFSQATAPATLPAVPTSTTAPAGTLVLPPTSAPADSLIPATTHAIVPLPMPMTAPAAASAPAAATPDVTVKQPFVATISSDKVYVRSGPGTAYYEMGQLGKGDLVYIMGSSRGWYQILPPNGTYCMIAKEFVEIDAGGSSGTVKGDYVNVRAGTALNKNRDPSAVLTVVRKGTKLKVLGSDDKYYQVAPPERAYVYISPQFVTASPGAEYRVPQLKLPAGATGPSVVTVEAPTTPPTAGAAPTILIPEPGSIAGGTATPATGGEPTIAVTEPTPAKPMPPLVPKVTFSETATARFNEVNSRYQEEARKPAAQQNVDGFLKDFKDILAMENVSPSVKAGADADIAAIERTTTVQRLIKEQTTADAMTKQQSEALREQYAVAERALAAARTAGPYSAEGLLQASTIVQGKYALVNPQTNRVVAYVDPSSSSVDIGSLVGKYIGVRGISKKMDNSDITVIQVSNATLMPVPK